MDHSRPLTRAGSRAGRRTALAAAALLLLGTGAATAAVGGAAQDGSSAPATSLSADGRTVSDGTRWLSASQTQDLDPAGQVVSISGGGFPPERGIYVALCVVPPTDQRPSPCGGGRGDQTTESGASLWFGTYPPGSGKDAATPYGPGGSFNATMALAPEIAPGLDCRQVRCALVTRADHTRSSDRSLDLFLPVAFAAASPTGAPPTTAPPPAPTVATTIPPLQPTQVAPDAAVGPDGRSVSDGTRTLRATQVADLDPEGTEVEVSGRGFDERAGIYVALCAVPEPDPGLPPGAATPPGPCAAGAPDASAWISSSPPDYGADLAVPYGEGGSFRASLVLRAVIDAEHDCREVACALATRNDDTNAGDRTQDLLLPVDFAASSSAADASSPAPGTALAANGDDRRGGSGLGPAVGLGSAAVVALGAGAAAVVRRRRRGAAAASGTT
jgi:hypothetical protein